MNQEQARSRKAAEHAQQVDLLPLAIHCDAAMWVQVGSG